jgi:hypothetical protein
MSNKAGLIKGISFGINEQIMTILAALGGLVNKKKSHLIGLLIIFALASALPDVYAFTATPEYKHKPMKKILAGASVFLTEMICVVLIGVPLVFINNKGLMLFLSMLVGIIIIIINELFIRKNTIYETIETCSVAGVLIIISYLVSNLILNKFKIKD